MHKDTYNDPIVRIVAINRFRFRLSLAEVTSDHRKRITLAVLNSAFTAKDYLPRKLCTFAGGVMPTIC